MVKLDLADDHKHSDPQKRGVNHSGGEGEVGKGGGGVGRRGGGGIFKGYLSVLGVP